MLDQLLCHADQQHLIELATLLAVADKSLSWDGKSKDEITSATDLNKVSIEKGEMESKLIAELESKNKKPVFLSFGIATINPIEERFIEKIKAVPLPKTEEPETRVQVATAIMKELLAEKKSELPFVPKLMLFELMLVALCGGSISNIQWPLLKEVQHHYRLKDFIFDDLLERAETVNREVSKTISIILE